MPYPNPLPPLTDAEADALRERWTAYLAAVARYEAGEDDDANIPANALAALDDILPAAMLRLLDERAELKRELADYRDAAEVEASLGDEARNEVAELERDRDALLAACKALLDELDFRTKGKTYTAESLTAAIELGDAALAGR